MNPVPGPPFASGETMPVPGRPKVRGGRWWSVLLLLGCGLAVATAFRGGDGHVVARPVPAPLSAASHREARETEPLPPIEESPAEGEEEEGEEIPEDSPVEAPSPGMAGILVHVYGSGEDSPDIVDAVVEAWDSRWNVYRGRTGDSGRVLLEVPPGPSYAVGAMAPGRCRDSEEVRDLKEGTTSRVLLALSRASPRRGVVLSAVDGGPVEGAVVRAYDEWFDTGCCPPSSWRSPPVDAIRTGPAGEFLFPRDDGWLFTVTVDAPGYRHLVHEDHFQDGEKTADKEPLVLRLEPGGVLRGKVVDPDGNPVPGALVLAVPRSFRDLDPAHPLDGLRREAMEIPEGAWAYAHEAWSTLRASADEAGGFTLVGLDPSQVYHAYAVAPRWASSPVATDVIAVPGTPAVREFHLRRAASLLVRLQGDAGARPEVLRPVLEGEAIQVHPAATAPWILQFKDLDPGEYRLAIESEDAVPVGESVVLAEGEEQALEVQLAGGVGLDGVVEDDRGIPIPDAEVEALPAGDAAGRWEWDSRRKARTDPAGRFRIAGLLARRHRMSVSAAEARLEDQEVTAPAEGLRLRAPRSGGFLLRVVRPEGAEGPFDLEHMVMGRGHGRGTTERFEGGRTGEFSSTGWYGRVEFTGRVEGFAPIHRWIDIVPGEILDLGDMVLDAGQDLLLRILDDRGEPMERLALCATLAGTREMAVAEEETPGAYRWRRLPRGTLELHAWDGWTLLHSGQVTPGERPSTLAWMVNRPGSLAVLVVDGDGHPVPGIGVALLDDSGEGVWSPGPWNRGTDEAGRMEGSVPAGKVRIRLSRKGQVVDAGEAVVARGERTEVRLVLPPRPR